MKSKYLVIALCLSAFLGCKQKRVLEDILPYKNKLRPSNTISYGEMSVMFEYYDQNQKKALDARSGKEETVSIYYTIQELKQYIGYVERLSKEKNIPLTGIRIFSAAYPEDYKIKEYQKKLTLIFAPTTTIKGKKGVAYEPLHSKKEDPIAMQVFLDKFTNETTRKVNRASVFLNPFATSSNLYDMPSSAANRGQLAPPPYPDSNN
jgi:hypothetical protein